MLQLATCAHTQPVGSSVLSARPPHSLHPFPLDPRPLTQAAHWVFAEGSGVPVVELLRTRCGPSDPELARAVRPASLRAQFGSSSARNAVHCTDLQEDAQLEVGFFFMR